MNALSILIFDWTACEFKAWVSSYKPQFSVDEITYLSSDPHVSILC